MLITNRLRKILLITVVIFCFSSNYAAKLYWVGGSGNFNDPSHWSGSDGGSSGSGSPTSSDEVYFTSNSFSASSVIEIIGNPKIKSLHFSPDNTYPVTFIGTSNETLTVLADFELAPRVYFPFDGKIIFESNQQNNSVNFSVCPQISSDVIFRGISSWKLVSFSQKNSANILLESGKLVIQNAIVEGGSLISNNAAATLELDNAYVKFRNDISVGSLFSLNATQSSRILYNASTITDPNISSRFPNQTLAIPGCATVSITAPTCAGACNGIVTFTLTNCAAAGGGAGPYDLQWLPGGSCTLPAASIGVPAGTHTVTNVCGCGTNYGVALLDAGGSIFDVLAVSITDPAPTVVVQTQLTQPSCNGFCNGRIVLGMTGTSPFNVVWTSIFPTVTHTNVVGGGIVRDTLKNVCSGSYTATITNANGCVITHTMTLNQPAVVSPQGSFTNVTCNGTCDGTATVNPVGGSGIYTFSWTPSGSTSNSISGLCASTSHTCTVTDSRGCIGTYTVAITQPNPITFVKSQTNLNCFDVCNGQGVLSGISGGQTPYSYSWSGPTSVTTSSTVTSSTGSGLCAGTYTNTITDALNCVVTTTFVITSPALLVITPTFTNPACNTSANGSINYTVTGGTPGYSCSVNGSAFGPCSNLTNLAGGNYTIITVDALGCNDTVVVTLTPPPPVTLSLSATNPTCFGLANGCVTATAGGGTGAAYSYTWTPAAANQPTNCTFSAGVGTATICVTVADVNGCTTSSCTPITSPSAINASLNITNVTCNALCNGSAVSTPSGGNGVPYSFVWSCSASITNTASALCAGVCTVTVSDGLGCNTATSFTVTQPNPFSVLLTPTALSCSGACTAQIASTISGGTPTYSYSWTPGGQVTPSLTNQCAGSYTLNVTDGNSCTATNTVAIIAPPTLTITATPTNPTCFNGCNGAITVVVSGGTGPYGVQWSHNGSTNLTQTNLCAGSYTVVATDFNNCTTTLVVALTPPIQLTVTPIPNDTVSCIGNCDGTLTANGAGGTGVITYSWLPGPIAGQTISSLCIGTYTATATDANGCQGQAIGQVMQPVLLNVTVPAVNPSCIGSCIGSATVTPTGGTAPYVATWNPVGPIGLTPANLCLGTYTVSIMDANGCTVSTSFIVTNAIVIAVNTSSGMVSCNGTCDGTAIANVAGGSGNYTYSWLPGPLPNSATVNGLCAGSYTLNVTDNMFGGCLGSSTFTITAPPALITVPTQTNTTCSGLCTGTTSVTASGGTAPYNYNWSTGAVSTSVANLCPGSYTVTVTDNNGCPSTQVYTLNAISQFTLTPITVSPSTCGALDGSLCINVTGGTPGYVFLWSSPPGGATNCISNIGAGTYTLTVDDLNGCDTTVVFGLSDPIGPATAHTQTNVACPGTCTGAANVTAVGTPVITFLWPDLTTNPLNSSLCAGNYPVQVTDGVGCTVIENITITEPSAFTFTTVVTNPSCAVGSSGTIAVTPSGGTSPYQFQLDAGALNGPSVSFTFNPVSAGVHTITIIDAAGCTSSFTTSVNSPGALAANATGSLLTCNGACNGSVTAAPSGGNPGYTYNWSDATGSIGNTQTVTALCAGTYTVLVTDVTGCTTSSTVIVTQPIALTNSVTATPNSCSIGCTGTATMTPAGGTGAYTYFWNSLPLSQTTSIATGLCPGAYIGVATDINGCRDTVNFTVVAPSAITATVTVAQPNCNASCDASLTVATSGGNGGNLFSWSPAVGVSATLTNACAGNYIVTITDANGCTGSASGTVIDPAILLANITQVQPTCFGLCDGSLTSTPSGGSGGYTFAWIPVGSITGTNSNLCSGTYSVIVTDVNGCKDTSGFLLNQPPAVNVISSVAPSLCTGPCNGTIAINTVTGTGPFTLLWLSNPPGGSSNNVTGLCAGIYSLQVTDNNLCQQVFIFGVSNSNGPIVNIDSTDANCNGSCDGTATVMSVTGAFLMGYSWNTAPADLDSVANNLCAGNYMLTTTDANNCLTITSVAINEPIAIDDQEIITNATCVGLNNGIISLSPSGGTGPYTFQLDGGVVSAAAATFTFSAVSAGTHTITILDSKNCPFTAIYVVGQNTTVVATTTPTNISCFGVCNGAALINNVNGGTAPYAIQWNDPNNQTSITASNLCAGNYSVTVTDGIGCIATFTTTVTQPPVISVVPTVTSTNCGQCTATANLVVTGGGGTFTFLWSDGQTSANATALCAGVYQVNIVDNLGCTTQQQIGISNIGGPTVTTTSVNPTCNGVCNGSASVVVVSGTAPYVYSWVNLGQSGTSVSNLCSGTYFIQVQDANNCIQTSQIILTNPAAIVPNQSVIQATCGNSDGSITLNPSGGSGAGYTFVWLPNASTTNSATNIPAGNYSITITDGAGCSQIVVIPVNNTNAPILTLNTDSVLCPGGSTGQAIVSIVGGALPYASIIWSNGSTGVTTVTGLASGNYNVVVTDAAGCIISNNFTIEEPLPLAVSIANTQLPNCSAVCNGAITAIPSGGTLSYTYLWNPGAAITPSINSLCAGVYMVTVTDANGCSINQTTNLVNNPTLFNPNSVIVAPTCGNCDGTITIGPTGGLAPYIVLWNTGSTSTFIDTVCAGVYQVDITDAQGCSLTIPITVSNDSVPSVTVTPTDATCAGVCNGSASTVVTGTAAPFTYLWLPGNETTSGIAAQCAGTYFVQVTDSNNCTQTSQVIIDEPSGFSANPTVIQPTCGACDGQIIIQPSGGVSPYTILWNTLETNDTITGKCAGAYNASLTDNNGCQYTVSVALNSINGPIVNITSTDVSCADSCTGAASVIITGGTLPISVMWSNSILGDSITGLCIGQYVATATDALGCITTNSVTINEPSPLVMSLSVNQQPVCAGDCNGVFNGIPSGGTMPFTFTWNPVGPNSPTYPNLCSGTYSLIVTDANGCTVTDSQTLTNPAVFAVSGVTTDASCNTTPDGGIDLTTSGGVPNYSWQWSGGSTAITEDLTNILSGTYTVAVQDANGCADTLNFTVNALVNVLPIAGNDTSLCQGGTITLSSTGSSGGTVYQWFQIGTPDVALTAPSAVPTNTVVTPASGSTSYYLLASVGGCVNSDTVTILSNTPPIADAGPDIEIIFGQTTPIGGAPTSAPITATQVWSPPTALSDTTASNPISSATSTITYIVTVVDTNGCIDRDTMELVILPEIKIPNGFSPNGDGTNDTWVIDFIYKFPNCEVEIFNRWGEPLFFSTGYAIPWDGRYKGKPLPIGTYYYVIKLNDDFFPEPMTGPLTILR